MSKSATFSPRNQAILKHLRINGSDSASNIGRCLGCPAASVRRSIQELQDLGWPISYAGSDGQYTLARPTTDAANATDGETVQA